MKNIIIFFPIKDDTVDILDPYQEKENAKEKQEKLLEVLWKNTTIFMARWLSSHIVVNLFSPQFRRTNTWDWVSYKWEIHADLVLWFKIPKWTTHIFPSISKFTKDKTIFEKHFPDLAIKSISCKNYNDIKWNFSKIHSKLKVLKPQRWTRSQWIYIQKNIPLQKELPVEFYPYLLQEFHDTSKWFYNFPWFHDFRIVMLNGEVIWKYLRQPAPWKYTANSFREWKLHNLKNWALPNEISRIVTKVESYLQDKYKHRYYSIDIGIWKTWEIKVFELNSAPWLSDSELAEKLWKYINKNILFI